MSVRNVVIGFVSMLTVGACSANDQDPRPTSGPPTAPSTALLIEENLSSLLSGSFSDQERAVGFRIEERESSTVVTITGSDGSVLLRSLASEQSSRLEIGTKFVLEARSEGGAEMPPRWRMLQAPDDLEEINELVGTPELRLVWQLGPALSQRDDLKLTVPDGSLLSVDPSAFELLASSRDAHKNHDPNGCAACMAVTTAALATCIGATWGIGSLFCAIVAAAPYAACGATVCS